MCLSALSRHDNTPEGSKWFVVRPMRGEYLERSGPMREQQTVSREGELTPGPVRTRGRMFWSPGTGATCRGRNAAQTKICSPTDSYRRPPVSANITIYLLQMFLNSPLSNCRNAKQGQKLRFTITLLPAVMRGLVWRWGTQNSPIYGVWRESQSWEDCGPQHPYIQTSEFGHSRLGLHGDNRLYLAPE